MIVSIEPSVAAGKCAAPPSKSLAHRYIICAMLANGKSTITNVDFSEDIKATIDCARALGATVDIDGSTVTVTGIGDNKASSDIVFNCRESGSTMRFFMGIAMYFGNKSTFYGSNTLRNRPFGIYEDICKDYNIEFTRQEDSILINGQYQPGEYEIKGNISSQFITGLLFCLPLFEKDSVIKLIPPVESRSYLDLTIYSLQQFGVDVHFDEDNSNNIIIKGGQSYKCTDIRVEGDCSNAAFLEGFNALGGKVEVLDVNKDTLQGDRVYADYYKELVKGHATLDISDCPDLGPVLFAVAAANKGGLFTGTKRLKIKESDRGTVMCEELSKFGVKTRIEENEIEIYECEKLCKSSAILSGHNDHRIVMSMSLLLSIVGGQVDEAEAVRKSYPGFFEDIKSLGVSCDFNGFCL